jgi:hypothetical protein
VLIRQIQRADAALLADGFAPAERPLLSGASSTDQAQVARRIRMQVRRRRHARGVDEIVVDRAGSIAPQAGVFVHRCIPCGPNEVMNLTTDITAQRRLEAELERYAKVDPATVCRRSPARRRSRSRSPSSLHLRREHRWSAERAHGSRRRHGDRRHPPVTAAAGRRAVAWPIHARILGV